jgi:hypothetical protein
VAPSEGLQLISALKGRQRGWPESDEWALFFENDRLLRSGYNKVGINDAFGLKPYAASG